MHMKQHLLAEILALPIEDRLRLVEAIWDSIASVPEALPLTDWQKEELDRRLDQLDREGPAGISWDEVLERIRNRAR